MTLVTFFFLFLKDSLSVDEKRMMMHSLDLPTLNIKVFVKKIIYIVFAIELIGAMLLTYEFQDIYPFKEALWYGVFHSVSAFNNAGFSLFTDCLISYNKSSLPLLTLSVLVILGGIGYFILIELYDNKKFNKRFSIQTKIMFYGTLFLLLFGTVLFLSIEWNNPKTLGEMSLYEKILNGFFLSVNFRTCLLYTSPSPRDRTRSRMPSSA